MHNVVSPQVGIFPFLRLHDRGFAMFKALLKVFITWNILKVMFWNIAWLEKRVMVVWCLLERAIEHRSVNGTRRLKLWFESVTSTWGQMSNDEVHTDEPCLTQFIIARHGEELTRFGVEAVLELVVELLSYKY